MTVLECNVHSDVLDMVSRVTVIPSLLNETLNGGLAGTLVPDNEGDAAGDGGIHPYDA